MTAATLSALLSGCYTACERHRLRRPYRLAQCQKWLKRRDSYADAAAVIQEHLEDRKRADHLTSWAAWNVMLWTALADMDAEKAWAARVEATAAFNLAKKKGATA